MAFADPGKDRQIISSGVQPVAPKVTVAEAVVRGDVLGYDGGWVKALAATGSVVQGRVVALADAPEGGKCPVSMDAVVDGYSGATPGSPVYVDEAAGGSVTQTIPTDVGDATTVIGIALSATQILFFLNRRADSVVSG